MKKISVKLLKSKFLHIIMLELLFVAVLNLKYPTNQTTFINLRNLLFSHNAFFMLNVFSLYLAIGATFVFFLIGYYFNTHDHRITRYQTIKATIRPHSISRHSYTYNGMPIYTALYIYPINKRKYAKIALAQYDSENFPDMIDCYYISSKKDAVTDPDDLFGTIHINSVYWRLFCMCFVIVFLCFLL